MTYSTMFIPFSSACDLFIRQWEGRRGPVRWVEGGEGHSINHNECWEFVRLIGTAIALYGRHLYYDLDTSAAMAATRDSSNRFILANDTANWLQLTRINSVRCLSC